MDVLYRIVGSIMLLQVVSLKRWNKYISTLKQEQQKLFKHCKDEALLNSIDTFSSPSQKWCAYVLERTTNCYYLRRQLLFIVRIIWNLKMQCVGKIRRLEPESFHFVFMHHCQV
jgi:hypothetical protein